MNCSHVPWNSEPNSDWNILEDWKSVADAACGAITQQANNESPTDIDDANSKGKVKREGYSAAGEGQGKQQNSAQYYMMMATKAMKGRGKSARTLELKALEPREG